MFQSCVLGAHCPPYTTGLWFLLFMGMRINCFKIVPNMYFQDNWVTFIWNISFKDGFSRNFDRIANPLLRICLINIMTLSQVPLETCIILKNLFTNATLDRGAISMSVSLVPVDCVFMDQLEAYITLQLVWIWKIEIVYNYLHKWHRSRCTLAVDWRHL